MKKKRSARDNNEAGPQDGERPEASEPQAPPSRETDREAETGVTDESAAVPGSSTDAVPADPESTDAGGGAADAREAGTNTGSDSADGDAPGAPGDPGPEAPLETRAADAETAPGDGPPPAEEEPAEGGREPARGAGPVLVVALVAALVVAVGAAVGAGMLWQRVGQLEQRVGAVPDEIAGAVAPLATSSELERLEERVGQRLQEAIQAKADELAAARQEGLSAVRERVDTLEQGVRSVRELAARDQVGWRLAEIRYLLAIAQRRLLIARDTGSAIAALESADRAIADLGSVRLLPLRQRIVEDLAALRAVDAADIEGIALRLQNLLGRVGGLPVADGDGGGAAAASGSGDTGTGVAADWWARIGERLDRFVTIRRRDAAPEPGRPEPARGLPQTDRLVLALEQARRAALARDPEGYDGALVKAGDVLEAGFEAGAEPVRRFAAALADLRGRAVRAELPTLDDTLVLADRLSARLEAESAAAREAAPADAGEAGEADEAAEPGADEPGVDESGTEDSGAEDSGADPGADGDGGTPPAPDAEG